MKRETGDVHGGIIHGSICSQTSLENTAIYSASTHAMPS